MIQWVVVKLPRINLSKPFGSPQGLSVEVTQLAKVGLAILVVINVVAQAVLVFVLLMGAQGVQVAPIASGAVVALFMLMYFYGRWMYAFLKGWQVLVLVLLKELGVFILLGLAVGVTMLIRWLAGG